MKNMNQEYHDYLKWILTDEMSLFKDSRAGGTIANTGPSMRFNMAEGLPLVNTKKLFYRGLIHEMVWFMRGPESDGELHVDYMIENKSNFWNKDVHNFYLKKTGTKVESIEEREDLFKEFQKRLKTDPEFRAEHGSLGRPYGAQWRDWKGVNGKSVDQLANAFQAIKDHSDSRRIIVEAWKADELDNMALPPCHKDFQFVVMGDRLDLVMKQRSADSFLGVPFNFAEYALLGIYAAEYAGLKPGVLTHQLVDAHIYCGVQEKANWYKNNFNELRNRLVEAHNSEDYIEIKSWIDNNADKPKEEWKEKYDHVTAVLEQLANDTERFCISQLEVSVDKNKAPKELLDAVKFEDFKVVGYDGNHYQQITRDMSTG